MGGFADEPALEASTDGWMKWGSVLMLGLIIAFPLYRLVEPGRRNRATQHQVAALGVEGQQLFTQNCGSCHGPSGEGGAGPALNSKQFQGSASDSQVNDFVAVGVPGTVMSAWLQDFGGPMTTEQIRSIVTYLRTWEHTAPDRPDWRACCQAASPSTSTATASPPPTAAATVEIPGDRFSPGFITVASGATVTWHNTDTDAHTLTTAPNLAPAAFNINVPGGTSATHTFTTPGLYVYYCTVHADWDATTGLPRAHTDAGFFPEAQWGIIAVQGPAPATASSVEIPGDRFSPGFITVASGATVTWHNTDTNAHTLTTAPNLAPAAFNINVPGGTSATHTFTTPGLYVYYCTVHADWDATTGLPRAHTDAGFFPEAQAGAVWVTPP